METTESIKALYRAINDMGARLAARQAEPPSPERDAAIKEIEQARRSLNDRLNKLQMGGHQDA